MRAAAVHTTPGMSRSSASGLAGAGGAPLCHGSRGQALPCRVLLGGPEQASPTFSCPSLSALSACPFMNNLSCSMPLIYILNVPDLTARIDSSSPSCIWVITGSISCCSVLNPPRSSAPSAAGRRGAGGGAQRAQHARQGADVVRKCPPNAPFKLTTSSPSEVSSPFTSLHSRRNPKKPPITV